MPHETEHAVLLRRAALLARPLAHAEVHTDMLHMVEFTLEHERYGIEARLIRAVLPLKNWTSLPGAPAHIAGLINVRSEIIAVLDVRVVLGLARTTAAPAHTVLILHHDTMTCGIIIDALCGVAWLKRADIAPALPTQTGACGHYVLGVTKEQQVVLDALQLLHDPALIVDEAATL